MDVQALPPAGLRHGDLGVLRRPATHRPHRMRRMHRIGEQHRFISVQVVQQVLIRLDEGRLLLRVQLARHRLRLAMLHAKAVQQRDQARPALIFDAAFLLDPGANLARRPRQCLADPGFQFVLLLAAQTAGAALVAEARQALDPIFLIQADTRCGSCRRPSTDTLAIASQLMPSSSSTSALARRARRWAADPSRASSIRSCAIRCPGSRVGSYDGRIRLATLGKGVFRVPQELGYSMTPLQVKKQGSSVRSATK